MDPRTAAPRVPDRDAVEFVRFCYHRRRVGWPELYDEMCAVSARGLFRGYDADDLAGHGIGFTLFDMPGLAALASRIVEEEKALRRPMTVVITDAALVAEASAAAAGAPDFDVEVRPATERSVVALERSVVARPVIERAQEPSRGEHVRYLAVPVTAGA